MKLKLTLLFLGFGFSMMAQENLSYQKPSKSILDLADYEREIGRASCRERVFRIV